MKKEKFCNRSYISSSSPGIPSTHFLPDIAYRSPKKDNVFGDVVKEMLEARMLFTMDEGRKIVEED